MKIEFTTMENKHYATFTDNTKYESISEVKFYVREGRFTKTWWNSDFEYKMFVYKSEKGFLKAIEKISKDPNYTEK